MTSLARATAWVLLTVLALALIWLFRQPIVLVIAALFVSAGIRPLAERLQRRGLSYNWGVGIIYGLIVLSLVAFVALLIGPLGKELQTLLARLSLAYERMALQWPQSDSSFRRSIANQLPPPSLLYSALAGQTDVPVLQRAAAIVSNVGGTLGQGLMMLILSLYWSLDHVRFERLWFSSMSLTPRIRLRRIWNELEEGVGAFMRSALGEIALATVVLWIGFELLGLRYPILLALIGGVVQIVPWLSFLLAVAPVLAVAFISLNPVPPLLGAGYAFVMSLLFEFRIQPRYFPRLQTSSLLFFVTAVVLAIQLGLVGLALAPAVAVAIQILWNHLSAPLRDLPVPPNAGIEEIQTRYQALVETINGNEGDLSPETRSLVNKLGGLVKTAQEVLPPAT